MLTDKLAQFNWVDLLIIIVLFVVCYVSLKKGFTSEIFKLSGLILSVYVSMHYYTGLSDLIQSKFSLKQVPLDFLDFIMFLILVLLVNLAFIALKNTVLRLIKIEAVSRLQSWGGLVLGIIRGYLLAGLIVFAMAISTVSYLKDSSASSYMGNYFVKICPMTYRWIWDNIASKFATGEKYNTVIDEARAAEEREK